MNVVGSILGTAIGDSIGLPGDVYIHCAEGHGRTALVATSILLARGDAQSAGEAIARVLEQRPLARMNAAQRKTVNEVAVGP